MKSIVIFQRRGFFLVCPYVHTVHRVAIADGPCIKLAVESTSAAQLGTAALQTLERAGAIVPHPEDWSVRPPSPVLDAAGVKSWSTFGRRAHSVELDLLENEMILTPTRKQGAMNFIPLVDEKLHLAPAPTAAELGEGIQQALTRCR